MTTYTSFRCYGCKKSSFTKQNLRMSSGHLYCSDCIKALPKVSSLFFCGYKTIRTTKYTWLKTETREQAESYLNEKLHAKEILYIKTEEEANAE